MRTFSLIALLAVAMAGECDESTCYICKTKPACDWYVTGPVSDCRTKTTAAQLGLNASACPTCQAGNCAACLAQNGTCGWWNNNVAAFGGVCGDNASAPVSSVYSYTLAATCPPCSGLNTCDSCQNAATSSCAWYVLPGGSGKCAEASPGFAYSKVASGACNSNVCAGSLTCSACSGVTQNVSNTTVRPCAWFKSKSAALYNSKCDVNETGIVSAALYDAIPQASCPVCSGATCTACKSESLCSWVAVVVGSTTSFGQCVTKAAENTVPGKNPVSVCPATCNLYSCSACRAKPECTWFVGDSVRDSVCDRATDADQHPFMTSVSGSQPCPTTCGGRASRCYECNQESGCAWYEDTFPGTSTSMGKATGDCLSSVSPGNNVKKIDTTNSKCDGNPNSALVAAPGFVALAIAAFVY